MNSSIPSFRSSSLWVRSGMFPNVIDVVEQTTHQIDGAKCIDAIGLTFVWIPLDRNRRVDDSFSLVSNAKENEAIENFPFF